MRGPDFAVRVRVQRGSLASPFQVATHISSSSTVKGNPVEITIDCSDASPPADSSSTIATIAFEDAPEHALGTGASTLPPAVIVSITSEPESDEVTKNTITSTMPTKRGDLRQRQSVQHREQLQRQVGVLHGAIAVAHHLLIATPPKTDIHTTQTSDGISSTLIRNSRTVRPRDTRAMNMPTKGDQLKSTRPSRRPSSPA